MDCSERLLIHKDGRATCTVPNCVDSDTLSGLERALARHAIWVNCDAVYPDGCAVCGPGRRNEPEPPSSPPPDSPD